MSKPKISVGIPYTDQGTILAVAIRSVLDQTFRDWELVLFGDGPDKITQSVAESFSDERIRHIVNPKRNGLAAALNAITAVSRADIIARMDGDDAMHPKRLEKQFEYLISHPTVDVVGSRSYLIDESSTVMGLYNEPELPKKSSDFLNSNAFTHPTVMGRREWFLNNSYNENLLRAEDKELWLRTAPLSSFAKLDEALFYYRIPQSLSWRRQARDSSYDRRIIRAYKHLSGRADIFKRLAKSYVKQCMAFGLIQMGASQAIYKTKYESLSPEEHKRASSLLNNLITVHPISSASVLAVTVTYGRRLHLVEQTAAAALAAGASEVLIVNNGMAVQESSALEAMFAGSDTVSIIHLEDNKGSAPGFREGLEAALETKHDYFLLLDDDNVIVKGGVKQLLSTLQTSREENPVTGVTAVRNLDEQHQKILKGVPASLAYPPAGAFMYFDVFTFLRTRLRITKRVANIDHPVEIPTAPYGGLLIDRETAEIIGLPNGELSLYEDDTEWSSRIAQHGSLLLDPSVTIEDLVGKHSQVSSGRGPERLLCSESPTRVFFAVRNRVNWEHSRNGGNLIPARYAVNRFIYLTVLKSSAKKTHNGESLASIKRAIDAGESGDLSITLANVGDPV